MQTHIARVPAQQLIGNLDDDLGGVGETRRDIELLSQQRKCRAQLFRAFADCDVAQARGIDNFRSEDNLANRYFDWKL